VISRECNSDTHVNVTVMPRECNNDTHVNVPRECNSDEGLKRTIMLEACKFENINSMAFNVLIAVTYRKV